MTETAFPRKPFLDRVIVRELPLEEIYQQSEIAIPLDDARVKDQSDRGIVVAVGDCVPVGGAVLDMPVRVGDLVFFEDTTLYDPIYLNPADKRRSDLPKYWQIRVGDLKGYDVGRRAALEAEEQEKLKAQQGRIQCPESWAVGDEKFHCVRHLGHSGQCTGVRELLCA